MRLFWEIFKHDVDRGRQDKKFPIHLLSCSHFPICFIAWRMVVWISNVNFHILGDFQTLCKTKEMNLIVYMSLLTTLIGEEIIGRENFSPGTPPFVKQWNRKENENTAINELETFCLGVLYLHSVWKSSKKGAFNIASEASCTYILSVQKFMKNTQNIKYSISASFWKPDIMVKQCYQTCQL